MPQKVKKDGLATVLVGDYELRRKVFAGDEVPDDWQLSGEGKEAKNEEDLPPVVKAKPRGKKADPEPSADG